MRGISGSITRTASAAPLAAGTGPSSAQSGNGFQMSGLARPMPQMPSPGLSTSGSHMLGAQMTSTLLQTQEDLSQTQLHGHGGRHNNMGMQSDLEAEEAEESEEAQFSRRRAKLLKLLKSSGLVKASEVDENGVVAKKDVKQKSANLAR